MTEKHYKRTSCQFCGANGRWIADDETCGKMTFVNVPGFDKHICIKTKVNPIEKMVAEKKFGTCVNEPVLLSSPEKTENKKGENEVTIEQRLDKIEERLAWLEYKQPFRFCND